MRKDKLDGCGDPIDPKGFYYIQDTRSFVGNAVVFWRAEGKGYTCDFEEAGLYLGDSSEVHSDRDTDVPWPVIPVRASRVTNVNADRLYTFKK